MKNNNQDLRVSARSTRLTAGIDDENDGPPWHFGGIAVAAGDVLHMDNGTRVLFTDEELKKAAETQAGEPLTRDHPEDNKGRAKYPPDTDETFGKVQKSGWVATAEGVGYEATTHDEDIARGVQAGSYEVSVHPFFDTEPYDGDEADVKATNIAFGDLSVVGKGDSPSNTVEFGPNQALANWTATADIGDELTASADDVDTNLDGSQRGLVEGAVAGALRAIGLGSAEDASVDAEGDSLGADEDYGFTRPSAAASENGPAEPGADDDTSHMDNNTREQYITFLTANAGFDKESVANMDDDVLEQTYELAASDAGSDAGGDGGSTDPDPDDDDDDDPQTLADMTVDDLGEALREQGFVTEDNAGDIVEQATAQQSKAEKVDEIVAKSDNFDNDDREELMASADSLVEREHKRVRGELAATLPGNAGQAAGLTAGATGSSDAVDEYGTGVKED
jgi:hypothetical protein